MGLIYRAENKITGKSYIGYTMQKFKARRRAHKEAMKKPESRSGTSAPFYDALREHGWMSFRWSILFKSDDEDELLEKERELIREYGTIVPNGYNLDVSRARPVRDDVTGVIYPSIRAASRETCTGHVHIMQSCNAKVALESGKKFSWVVSDD